MKRITANTIETIATKLRRMPPVKKPPEFTRQEAIELLKSEIGALQKRGYSLAQISKTLRDEGLEVDAATLKGYLQPAPEVTREKKPKPTKKAAVPAKKAKKVVPARAPVAVKTSSRRAMFDLKPDTDDI